MPLVAISPPPLAPVPGTVLRILLADDMPELCELSCRALSRAGHQVDSVGDGAQALQRLTQAGSAYDLLITDHHMPVMDGLTLVSRARALPFAGRILVATSDSNPAVAGAYAALGVRQLLGKPLSVDALQRALAGG